MTQRLRRILIMIVMALLTVTLMAASLLCSVTYARYAGGKFNEEKSIYDQIIEFVGANQYEVYSPEELVEAIENGYSYIKIGKGAEEPFVITTGVTDVTANLVIDLNGTTIVRNSRNPVLDVQRNVSAVLVFDSSVKEGGDVAKDAGSFYNPVGSALQVSGGTLTVAAGRYDSGPKDGIAVDFTEGNATSFKLFKRNGSRADDKGYTAVTGDSAQGQVTMPALTADVYIPQNVSSGYNFIEDDTYLIYSEEQNCYESGDSLIVNVVDGVGDELAVPCNAASCDFYYYYPIDEDGNPIKTDGTASAPQTYAVVYGYNDVKRLAEDSHDTTDATETSAGTDLSENGLVWPYAAVRSIRSTETVQEGEGRTTGGEGFMRGGTFNTYFGTVNTYGIYAEGGTLSVADGVSFTAVGEGVCIRSQTSSTTTDSNAAASLEISGGTFSSQLGDTIQMEGGSVTITGGAFVKDASSAPNNRDNNGSAIDIQGGTLKVNADDTTVNRDVTFTVTGDHVNGIKMTKTETATQSDTISNATFNFNPLQQGADSSLAGGSSVAAIQVIGGSLNVSGSNFNFNTGSTGTSSANNGIYVHDSEEGKVSGSVTATRCTFTFGNDSNSSVTASAGIASVGGEVTAEDCKFTLPGYSNYGIYATGGKTTVTGGSITMTGDGKTTIGSADNAPEGNDNFGINISGGEVTVSGCDISVSGTYSSGILAQGGEVNLSGTDADKTTITITGSHQNNLLTSSAVSSETVTNGGTTTAGTINIEGVVTINSDSLGITARGTINVNGGTTSVDTDNATGVYVNNGSLTVDTGAVLKVDSTISSASYSWVTPPGTEGEPISQIYNGVFVHGGSLVSNGILNVTFTGVENENSGTYLDQQIKSYAVRVDDSENVTIAAGEIKNTIGGGVYVGGGTVTLGKQETTNGITTYSGPTVQTTGELLFATVKREGWWPNYHYTWNWRYVVDSSWQYMLNKSGGHAVEVSGGSLTVHGGNYTAQQGNGILIRNTSDVRTTNTVKINSGSFLGYNSGYYVAYGEYEQTPLGGGRMVGPAASYGLNVMGHDLDVTINGGEFGNNEGDVGNSAASFFGTPDGSRPQVAVHGGTFNANNADAISVFRFIDITFDGTASQISSNISDGDVASLSVQNDLLYTGYKERGSTIAIQSGTFTGTAYGIWYACGYDKLSISGNATIKGPTGLQVASAPVENGIAISGGTIEGGTEGIYYNASASVEGEGYGLNITGGTIRGTGNNKNGHALNIVVEPKKHAIHIGGEAQLFGGRDAIYVNNAGDEENAVSVSITGGTFTGAEQDTTAGDYGCAIWFNSGMNSSVYQITGGTFITQEGGSAIWTSNPDGHFLWQIFPDGCSITDGKGNSFDRISSFDAINGKSEITVSRS